MRAICQARKPRTHIAVLIRSVIPPLGQVRLITVTDLQFGKMEVFYGKKPRDPEEIPEQILLF